MTSTRPRILFVTPVSPFSAASGSEQRSSMLLQALREIGRVDVLQLTPGETTRVWRADLQTGAEGHDVIHAEVGAADGLRRYRAKPELTASVEAAFGTPLSRYRLIVGRYLWSLCQLVLPTGVPTLMDLDDFRYRYGREAGWSLALIKERCVKALNFRLARRQLHRFSAAFVVSERDKALLGGMPSRLLTNVPWSIPNQVTPVPDNKRLLFVGSLWYRPNADGVDWFLAKVWPAVRAAEPQATLQLVGPASPQRRASWERHAGVSAPGFVDDLAAAYATASVVVVPVHSGGGSNIKVLEALAHGRPCVASRLSWMPFEASLRPDIDLAVASSAATFAAEVASLLRTNERSQRMANSARRIAQCAFTGSSIQGAVQRFAGELILRAKHEDASTSYSAE